MCWLVEGARPGLGENGNVGWLACEGKLEASRSVCGGGWGWAVERRKMRRAERDEERVCAAVRTREGEQKMLEHGLMTEVSVANWRSAKVSVESWRLAKVSVEN